MWLNFVEAIWTIQIGIIAVAVTVSIQINIYIFFYMTNSISHIHSVGVQYDGVIAVDFNHEEESQKNV